MKLTYGEQTIDFLDFDLPKTVLISLSGGLDSASLFYLTCKYAPQVEIVPVTCRDQNAPLDALAAMAIVEWMRLEFPNVTIHDHEIHDFNDKDERFVKHEESDFAIKTVEKYRDLNRRQMSKILQVDKINYAVLAKWPRGTIRFDGMTSNPPVPEMIVGGFDDLCEVRRTLPELQPQRRNLLYQPFVNVNKKFVAGIYKEHGLMDSLYTFGRSCTGGPKETNNYTKECHDCFWCYEKKWAFDLEW